MEAFAELVEEGEMCGVSNRVPIRMEGHAESKTEHGSHPGSDLDRDLAGLAAFDPSDPGMRRADLPSELALAQCRSTTGGQELARGPGDQISALASAAVDGALMDRHDGMMRAPAHPALT